MLQSPTYPIDLRVASIEWRNFEDFLTNSRVQYSLPYEAALVVIEDFLRQSCADELVCVVWTILKIQLLVLSISCADYHVPHCCLGLAEKRQVLFILCSDAGRVAIEAALCQHSSSSWNLWCCLGVDLRER